MLLYICPYLLQRKKVSSQISMYINTFSFKNFSFLFSLRFFIFSFLFLRDSVFPFCANSSHLASFLFLFDLSSPSRANKQFASLLLLQLVIRGVMGSLSLKINAGYFKRTDVRTQSLITSAANRTRNHTHIIAKEVSSKNICSTSTVTSLPLYIGI